MGLQTSSILPHRVAVDSLKSSSSPRLAKGEKKSNLRYGARIRSEFRLTHGCAGDHFAIYSFLQSLMQGSSDSEFQLNLDRPGYDPNQRLLLWRGDDLVGHIRVTRRMIRWGKSWLPTCDLSEFALLPEFSQEAQRVRLLQAAEAYAVDRGAVLLTCRTYGDAVPAGSSWIANGGMLVHEESPRSLLAKCASFAKQVSAVGSFRVRPWRYVEQRELAEIYDANTVDGPGSTIRDDEYWRWLLVRRGFDEILVVTTQAEHDTTSTGGEIQETIFGYAFVRGNDIVEMMVVPDRPEFAVPLIQRVAADAIERNDRPVRLFRPAWPSRLTDVLDAVIGLSDRSQSFASTQAVFAAEPLELLDLICEAAEPEIVSEFSKHGLGLELAGTTVWVGASRQGRLERKRGKRTKACCYVSPEDVTPLLLGSLAIDECPASEFSTVAARRMAKQLFQPVTLWRSTLDDLPSSN